MNYLVMGILVFVFFGGLKIVFSLIPVVFALFFQFLPMILLYFFIRSFFKNQRLGGHVQARGRDHTRFVELLVGILIHAVHADGDVDDRELKVIRDFFSVNMGFSGVQREWVNDLISKSLSHPPSLSQLVSELNRSFGYDSKIILLQLVYRVVMSDKRFLRRV
jgi:uncharacterized tellurite resistance protein B-like protein